MNKNRTFIKAALSILAFVGFSFLTSCEVEEIKSFDATLLEGKWVQGTLYERYHADNTGYTWDTSDDVTEEEAQNFTWSLDGDQLLQIHIMEIGGNIPKTYTVTELSETTFAYNDDYGTNYFYKSSGIVFNSFDCFQSKINSA